MKNLALVFGICVAIIGAAGILAPSGAIWIARHVVTSGAFYVIATVRISFGAVLVSVASASRAPKTIRVLGYVIMIAGMTTALTGMLAIERARDIIGWWLRHGSGVLQFTGVSILAIGGFIAYACAPVRHAD